MKFIRYSFLLSLFIAVCFQYISVAADFQTELKSDWLAQADGHFDTACVDEISRISRLLARSPAELSEKFSSSFNVLKSEKPSESLYLKLRALKRDLIFSNPEIDFSEVICSDSPYPRGSEAPHESRFKTENTAVYGARLLRVNIRSGGEKVLAPSANSRGAIWRSDVDFDGKKIVFQMREKGQSNYNLYVVNADGSGLSRLTSGGYNDVDPAWLPDGGIVFCTSRANCYVRCGGSAFRSTVLARCDADGKNIYFISTNNESDYMPFILSDGRILYCRWEYVDKNIFRVQALWTVNPDGTNPQVFWGGQSHYPDLKIHGVQIPDSEKIIFQTSSHHNVFNSGLAIIDQSEGTNYPDGIYNLTPHIGWTEAKFGPWDKSFNADFSIPKVFGGFYSPYPVSKNFYLVSARIGGTSWGTTDGDKNFSLYLADFDGNMELIKSGAHNLVHAMPLRARARPRTIPSSVEPLGDKPSPDAVAPAGVLYSANVYEGSGIPFGAAKKIRVIEHCAATYQDGVRDATDQFRRATKAVYFDRGDLGIYDEQSKKISMRSLGFLSGETSMSILLDESHKRILGDAEIESDGSVCIEIPSMKAVYFQMLDAKGNVIQTMRSSTHVMAGESRGCLGCHATKFAKAPPTATAKALRRPPQKLSKPFGDITFGFERYIQPILDRHCVLCHNHRDTRRIADRRMCDSMLDLENRKIPADGIFTAAYLNLVIGPKRVQRNSRTAPDSPVAPISSYYVYPSPDTDVPVSESVIAPYQVLSGASSLVKRLEKGHGKTKITAAEIDLLKAWIDLNCPFYGEEDVLDTPDVDRKVFESVPAFVDLSYLPKMRTSPDVDRSWRQDKYSTQDDRCSKDEKGVVLPSVKYENGVRKVLAPR